MKFNRLVLFYRLFQLDKPLEFLSLRFSYYFQQNFIAGYELSDDARSAKVKFSFSFFASIQIERQNQSSTFHSFAENERDLYLVTFLFE